MDPDADCIFGSAGKDYPTLRQVPDTRFGCGSLLPGIYADTDAACQVNIYMYISSLPSGRKSYLLKQGEWGTDKHYLSLHHN